MGANLSVTYLLSLLWLFQWVVVIFRLVAWQRVRQEPPTKRTAVVARLASGLYVALLIGAALVVNWLAAPPPMLLLGGLAALLIPAMFSDVWVWVAGRGR